MNHNQFKFKSLKQYAEETGKTFLLSEWDYDNNLKKLNLTPETVAYTSKIQVYWLTPNNISYKQAVGKKTRIKNNWKSPFSTKVLVPGYNDFASLFPEIAKEWDCESNAPLTPDKVKWASGQKVWWKCSICGKKWKAAIRDRANSSIGCPLCKSKRNTSFPEQALYFYIKKLFPDAINRCKTALDGKMELDIYIPSIGYGIEYDGLNWHSTSETKKRDIKKYQLCKQKHIRLIRIVQHDWIPFEGNSDIQFFIAKKPRDKQIENLIWQTIWHLCAIFKPYAWMKLTVDLDKDRSQILHYLTRVKNSLVELRPDIAKEWHPTKNGALKPEMFSLHSNTPIWWKCSKCGHEWRTQINHRTRDGRTGTCPICAQRIKARAFVKNRIAKVGSLAQTHPELAKEWHPTKNGNITPNDVTASSSKWFWWLCPKCGYEWKSQPNNRKKSPRCPCCCGRVAHTGVNDIATLHQNWLRFWDFDSNTLDPHKIKSGSDKKVHWICPNCKHKWIRSVIKFRDRPTCPKCKTRA